MLSQLDEHYAKYGGCSDGLVLNLEKRRWDETFDDLNQMAELSEREP